MKECFDAFNGLVWGIASRYIGDRSDAEDVVQEIFAELWRKADRFDRSRASESTFVGLIARRRSIDWLRKRSRQPSLEPITDDIASGESDRERACARIDAETVQRVMTTLPKETRELFRLHFEQGMTHPEIATETGLPLGTVKTKLRRGLIEMRSKFSKREGGYEVR